MADAMRAALVDRLADARRTERLPGVDGDVDVALEHELEGGAVSLGGIVLLLSGQIESQHAAPLVGHRELGERQRGARVHRADAADYHARREPELPAGFGESGYHR